MHSNVTSASRAAFELKQCTGDAPLQDVWRFRLSLAAQGCSVQKNSEAQPCTRYSLCLSVQRDHHANCTDRRLHCVP